VPTKNPIRESVREKRADLLSLLNISFERIGDAVRRPRAVRCRQKISSTIRRLSDRIGSRPHTSESAVLNQEPCPTLRMTINYPAGARMIIR
jgi:hypothetical protein